jgi:hypothetical protein
MKEDAFIEREWLAVAPDGTEQSLLLRVGNASRHSTGDWVADVSLGALEPRPHAIHGIDSWQAVHEAMRFAAVISKSKVGVSTSSGAMNKLVRRTSSVASMRSNDRLEFARVARPTRKSDVLLLAAQPER